MTAAEVPQPGVPVEDSLHEWPVARSVPGGLACEGRPVAARYLFNLGEPVTTGDAELVTGGWSRVQLYRERNLAVCVALSVIGNPRTLAPSWALRNGVVFP